MSTSLARLTSTTATVRRNEISDAGISAGFADVYTAVPVSPPVPVSGTPTSDITSAPQRSYTAVVRGEYDVRYGDLLVVDGVTYEVVAVAPYPAPRTLTERHTSLTIQERLTR